MPLKIIWEKNTAQIGMTGKSYSHQIKNLTLKPVRTGPHWAQRIHHGIRTIQPHFQTNLVFSWNGNQVVVQFESRFVRVTVHAGGIREQVKLKRGIFTTSLRHTPQNLSRQNNRRLPAKLNHFLDRVGIPRAQVFNYNISVLAGILSHRFEALRRSLVLVPVQRALFPQIEVTDQEYSDIDHHLGESIQAGTWFLIDQVPVNVCPRI